MCVCVLFQKSLIAFLKRVLPSSPKKIVYFSDGAASQYKNPKNFINLCNHEAYFGIQAEWHFSATSHGKGASDGVGGTVKHLAARASLQRPYERQIMTPLQHLNGLLKVYQELCSSIAAQKSTRKLNITWKNDSRILAQFQGHVNYIPLFPSREML